MILANLSSKKNYLSA